MEFIVELYYPFNDSIFDELQKKQYEIIYTSDVIPTTIGLQKETGSVQELKQFTFIKKAMISPKGSLSI